MGRRGVGGSKLLSCIILRKMKLKYLIFSSHEGLKAEANIYLDQLIYHYDCSCFSFPQELHGVKILRMNYAKF